ncbi:helix-turn-helix domain-containing protein [soil metagenome]
MPSTHLKVSPFPTPLPARLTARKQHTPLSAAIDTEACFSLLGGRWKLLILFNLFDGKVLRFSELEKRITGVSQKMLTQQLRQLEADGIVQRTVHEEVPPRVDYQMTPWGQRLCPALDGLLEWSELKGHDAF